MVNDEFASAFTAAPFLYLVSQSSPTPQADVAVHHNQKATSPQVLV
jgi:hypothetical protein